MIRARPIEPDPPTHRGGSGEPLVLVHGGGGTPRLWRTTIPLLEPHHDVLTVTLDGHFGGRPIASGVEASVETLARGVERERFVAAIRHAEVVDLPGAGHAAMVDDPELVARTILDFTARHGAGEREGVSARD
jgi:pimeloyl-ACP methyl ester carboxylesterase